MFDFSMFPTTEGSTAKNFGWNPKLAAEAWEKVKNNFDPFKLEGKSLKKKRKTVSAKATARKQFLHQVVRKVVGKDLINWAQEAGSCVSETARSCCNYLSCVNISVLNKSEKFRPSYAPYHYGTSRVFVGAKHGVNFGYNDDGSIGSFMAEAVQEYGNLFADTPGVEEYSGQAGIARKWGYRPGPKKEFVEQAKNYLVKKASRITNWEDYVEAIVNGYPIHYCSMLSFTMSPNSKGFHNQTSEGWAHALTHIGVDDEWKDPYVLILNSWGNCHGQLYDFYTNEPLPVGVLRVHKSVIERDLRNSDTEAFAFSDMDGFYERKNEIDKALFDLFGN